MEKILQKSMACRESDKLLLLSVWQNQGLTLTKEQKNIFLYKCSSQGSITRVRRKFQEEGKYLSEEQCLGLRKMSEKEVRNYYRKN